MLLNENGAAFDRWFDTFLTDQLRQRPIDATCLGAHEHNGALPDYSLDGERDRLAAIREQVAALDRIPFDGLAESQIFDRALARGALELQHWEAESRFFQAGNPAHHTSEALLGVVSLFFCETAPLADRVEAAIYRMRGLPAFLETARNRVATAPLLWTERAMRQTDAGIAFFHDEIRLLATERGIDHPEFLRTAEMAARAFDTHAAWLQTVLYERRSPFHPAGTEAFDRYLRRGHLLPEDQTVEWWFDYAHAELVETTRELRELAASIDVRRPARQQLSDLAGQHPAASNYYAAFDHAWRIRRQQAIDADLVTWPENAVDFLPIPRFGHRLADVFPWPRYRGFLPFADCGSCRVFVPPCDPALPPDAQDAILRQTNDTRIDLDFAIRIGGLGRHLQCAGASRATARVGRIAGAEGAIRPFWFCAGTLVDGWATYSTELMEESGALTDLQRLSEAQHRVRLAARAVADTAIHSGEFTIQRAARFLRDEANLPASVALQEAVERSMFPATGMQALAGAAAIDELRRQLEDREGAAFSLRSFHDRLLSCGAIPVTLIAASMLG